METKKYDEAVARVMKATSEPQRLRFALFELFRANGGATDAEFNAFYSHRIIGFMTQTMDEVKAKLQSNN